MFNKIRLSDFAFRTIVVVIISLSTALLQAQAADAPSMSRGTIVITTVQGSAKILKPGSTEGKKATKGVALQQGEKILTEKNSSVALAFENGSVIKVEPESSFVVEEFLQAPWEVSEEALRKMKTEPSNSKLAAFLEYGQVTSGVKKLNPGSSLTVTTPLGSAGIRGTDFQVALQRDAKGASKGFSVTVASGEVAVSSNAGGTTSVTAGSSSSIAVTPGADGKPSTVSEPVTAQIPPESTLSILQSVQAQQAAASAVLTNAMLQSDASPASNLNQQQQDAIEDAAAIGTENLVNAVQQLAQESPASSPNVAAFATTLVPDAAPEIAAAAATGAPQFASQIAADVASMVPPFAPQIAASVALAVPASAPNIAASVASVVPSQAPQIASSVATALPEAAAAIARSVAQSQPQQAEQIAAQTSAAAPDSAEEIASQVQAQGEGGTDANKLSPSDLPATVPTNQFSPPPATPEPTSTPTPPSPTPPSPTATPQPTSTPNPSNG